MYAEARSAVLQAEANEVYTSDIKAAGSSCTGNDDSFATPASSSESENTAVTEVGDESHVSDITTPTQADKSEISTSFIFPSRSYDVQQFANIKDAIPEWDDDEVDELVVLSEKQRILDDIDENQELSQSASGTSIDHFAPVRSLSSSHLVLSSSSSNVALFKHMPSSSLYAIKTFTKSSISYDTPTLEHAMKEQMILRLLTQMEVPYVLKLRWSFQDSESMRLVTDFCPGRDLRTRVTHSGPIMSPLAWLYAAELTEAISSLHASGICHRSIRPEHILISAGGHVVLTGFSCASIATFNSPRTEHRVAMENKEAQTRAVDVWSAPEIVLGWSHDFAVDCWGFGAVLCYMLTGQHPLLLGTSINTKNALDARLIESAILHGPLQLHGCENDANGEDLITKCLERNPRIRFTTEDIKTHEYFADIDWPRLREKGYPAPTPPLREDQEEEDISFDTFGIQESETLRGVHIAGFNYAFTPNHRLQRMDIISDDADDSLDQNDTTPHSADSATLEDIPTTLAGEGRYVTPAGSIHSSGAGSAVTASTALYSCTSFGELREALKARPSEKFPLPVSADAEDDFQSNVADVTAIGAARSRMTSRRSSAITELRPTGILLRNDSRATSVDPEPGLGARGLGLRKYASLDFDLDTVVSLETDLATSKAQTISGASGAALIQAPVPTRRVSFLDATTSAADTIVPADGTSSPWKNLSKYYSPNPNMNKLRKKRNESMPLLDTPRLQERVALPDGVEQIGLGIGYTAARLPRAGPGTEKEKITPRTRALSVGSSLSVALLSHIRGRKLGGAQEHQEKKEPERASEESDAMDAIMQEMYGAAWNSEFGVGYLQGSAGAAAPDRAVSSRKKAGRVHSVDADAEGLLGSTLRLVQTPNTAETPVQ